MNTTSCCSPTVVPLQRPLAERWWLDTRDALRAAWQGWQQRRRMQAELSALQGLDAATLRDLGLGHLVRRSDLPQMLRDLDVSRW